jgi:hypothetical protein
VYAGSVGKALTTDGAYALPWYGYLAIGAVILAFGQFIAKYATGVIEEMEKEDEAEQSVRDAENKNGKGKKNLFGNGKS